MSNKDEQFWLEVDVESALNKAEKTRRAILGEIPPEKIYTITGEINPNTRWGATVWTLNQFINNLRALGF